MKEKNRINKNDIVNKSIGNKLKVFISSNSGDKYKKVKLKLKNNLEKTGLIDAYCFEGSPGSSRSVVNSYMPECAECDLFVVLIDNYDGVGDGTNKEISLAKSHNKRKIYFFCTEKSKEQTVIQEELNESLTEKYKEIDKMEDFPLEAYMSIMQDLVSYFKYINKKFADKLMEQNYSKYVTNTENIILKDSINNTYVRNSLVCKHYNEDFLEKSNRVDVLDIELANQLDFILFNRKFDEERFDTLQCEILKLYRGKLKEIIKERLNIQKFYYKEDYDTCLFKLKNLIKELLNTNAPSWLYLDIAIDIRHIQSLIDERKNIYRHKNDGQKYIDDSDEIVYFPIVDRRVTELYTKINEKYYEKLTASPYSRKFENIYYLFFPIADEFIAAQIYGSIVNTNIIRRRLIDLYACILNIYDDHRMLIEYLGLLIIENDLYRIENTIRLNSNIPNIVSEKEIEEIVNTIDNNYDSYRRKISMLDMLASFGYCIDDKLFIKYTDKINYYIVSWLEEDKRIFNMWKHIYAYLKNIKYRLDDVYILNIIIKLIKNKIYLNNYRDYFEILSNIDFSKLAKYKQKEVLQLFKIVVSKEYIDSISNDDYSRSLIKFCKQATIDTSSLEKLVEKEEKTYFEEVFNLELIDKYKINPSIYISNYLKAIENEIELLKKGLYHQGDNYKIIYNIIYLTKIRLDTNLINEIINVCKKSLENSVLFARDKISALLLLLLLENKYSKSMDLKNFKHHIQNNKDKYCLCNNLTFDKIEEKHLKLMIELFLSTNQDYDSDNVFDLLYLKFNENTFDRIESLRLIYNFVKAQLDNDIPKDVLNKLMYYVYSNTSDNDRDVRYYSSLCLIELVKYKSIKNRVSKYLSMLFDSSSPEIKVAIASRIKKIKTNNKYISSIIQKARTSSNYFVRYSVKDI